MLTLGDLRAQPGRVAELRGDDVLVAAASGAEVVLRDASKAAPEATLVFQHETMAMMKAGRAAELKKLKEQLAPRSVVIPIRKKPGSFWDHVTLGRASTNDIVLGDPAVSNVHAHFEMGGHDRCISLKDLGSSNGTFVNREPLQPHVLTRIEAGDCLRFGQSVFYFVPSSLLAELAK